MIKDLINNFIEEQIYDLQEEGALCLEMCEDENNFHMVTYWLKGTYDEVYNFISEHYKKAYAEELYKEIFSMYSKINDLEKLESKVKNNFSEGDYNAYLAYETLASILLNEFQNYSVWYTVYGSEEVDFCDLYGKYNISSAYYDSEKFPVVKSEDITAAMLGINSTLQPSDMYDVFAYKADDISKKTNISLFDNTEEGTFTPDLFQYEAVLSRWKNYTDIKDGIKRGKNSDLAYYLSKKLELESIYSVFQNNISNIEQIKYKFICDLIKDRYINQFSKPPLGLPLHKNNFNVKVVLCDDNTYRLKVFFKIRGVQNYKQVWKDIYKKVFDIPSDILDVQKLILTISEEIKVMLSGKEKPRNSKEQAIEGLYPRKNLANHGLKLQPSLSLCELQTSYIIKKLFRITERPVLSCSFGNDSIVTLHNIRRVTKKGFDILFNNSGVEYSETIAIRNKLIKEWDIGPQLIETKPEKTYWEIADEWGWNFERKGSRKVNNKGKKRSNSEICCDYLKHKPTKKAISKYKWDIDFSGLRADESLARSQAGKRDGTVYYAKSWGLIKVNPILFYTNEMTWEYVKKHNVPYSDIYDKILYDDEGNIKYAPRTGCWSCLLTTSRNYLMWLKEFKPKQYWFLMDHKGLAKTLFIMGGKKMGVIPTDYTENVEKKNNQVSMFDDLDSNSDSTDTLLDFDLDNLDIEYMENLIQKFPCKFQSV